MKLAVALVVLACAPASAEPCGVTNGRVVGVPDDPTAPSVILVTDHPNDSEASVDVALWRDGRVEANAAEGAITFARAADIERQVLGVLAGLPMRDDDDDDGLDVGTRRRHEALRPLDDQPGEITIIVRDGSGWRVVTVDSALTTLLHKQSAFGDAAKLLVGLRVIANAPLRAASYTIELDELVDYDGRVPWPTELPVPNGRDVTIGAKLLPIVDRLRERMIREHRFVEVRGVAMTMSVSPRIPGQNTIDAVLECASPVREDDE